jgi:uncharacterized protein (DUF305 family)
MRNPVRKLALAGAAAAVAVAGVTTAWVTGRDTENTAYARMMSVHHGQAVEMALRVAMYGADPDLRVVAVDALLTQQNQVGRFQQFLDERGATSMLEPGETMPGMVPTAALAEFRTLTGVELDRRFVALMIDHHIGGVEMSRDALDSGLTGEMARLGRSVIASQTAEINGLRAFAERLG